jgi:1-acyl-sn-glycerol-3-phosphate acyltransferase
LEPPAVEPPFEVLTPFERLAFRLMRFWNLGAGKGAALVWQRLVITPLVGYFVGRRLRVHGLERLADVPPDAAILLVSNHRTFFDLWVLGRVLQSDARLRRRPSFPVRANFFYESPLGLLICMIVSGGTMFPPFFRSAEKMPFNKASLALLIDKLRRPGHLVGFHPEGTRNRSDDPYDLLPAQPGAGELALKARPVVVPAFISGMTNSALSELWANLQAQRPIVAVFGAPVDLSAFPAETRLSHHKRCADLFNERIAALGAEERALRERGG